MEQHAHRMHSYSPSSLALHAKVSKFSSKVQNISKKYSTNTNICRDVNGMVQVFEIYFVGKVVRTAKVFSLRKVITDFPIVTTPINVLFLDDLLIPVGRLREPKRNIKRANCIVITRCPNQLSSDEKRHIRSRFMHYNKPVFFSSIRY